MTNIDNIRHALAFVPAHDRDLWVRIGMAIKSELGEDGFDPWSQWSQQHDSYNDADARSVWRGINSAGKVNIGTLFHEAQQRGYQSSGHARPEPPSPEETERRAERVRQAEAEEAAKHAKSATLAADVFKGAMPARADHPYLERKKIPPVITLRELPAMELARLIGYVPKVSDEPLTGRALIAPVRIGDELSTLEFIDEAGRKSALHGGAKADGFWPAQRMPEGDGDGIQLLIAEGVATAVSAGKATGNPSFAALSCHNLTKAATALRTRYPEATVVICGDLGNGSHHAINAARAVGGRVAFPEFGAYRPEGATDFNDMAQLLGHEAVKRAIANATAPEASTHQPASSDAPAGDTHAPTVMLIRGDTIEQTPVAWLWEWYIAIGKMHIIAGAPGTGKTTLAMALAATITQGGRWPDGMRAPTGDVLIWSGEDAAGDTLAPRLSAAGADLARVHFVGDVREGNEPIPFDPSRHFAALALAASRLPALRMMIVDPIVSAVAGDSHQNAEVRRALQPLVAFADAAGIALIGISHFTKGTQGREPLERVTGSLGFGAVARIVFGTAKLPDDDDGGGRALVRLKSNIGPDGGGFKYELRQVALEGKQAGIVASRVEWCGVIEGSAREILAQAEQVDEASGGDDPKEFLRNLLTEGPMGANEIFRDAKANGFSDRQMQRACKSIGATRHKRGMNGGWQWVLPKMPLAPEDAEGAGFNSLASSAPSAVSSDQNGSGEVF